MIRGTRNKPEVRTIWTWTSWRSSVENPNDKKTNLGDKMNNTARSSGSSTTNGLKRRSTTSARRAKARARDPGTARAARAKEAAVAKERGIIRTSSATGAKNLGI